MTRPLVYVAREIPPCGLKLLQSQVELRIHRGQLPPTRSELIRGVAGCSGILSLLSDRIDQEVMEAAGNSLKVVANYAVGFNNIDLDAARQRGVVIGNTPDVLTDATADIAVGLLLAAARRFGEALADAQQGRWKTWEPRGWIGRDLRGKTLGIVGMGRIGEAVARRMHGGWDMQVLYASRTSKPEVEQRLAAEHVALDELLARSDFVSLHVPLSEATKHLIDSQRLAQMPSHAVLINTARGEIIDQQALIDALENHTIFAAGLDVCTPEPLPLENRLLHLPNSLVLPHVGSATVEARDAMSLRSAENIIAGLRGEPLPYPVE
jgi:glyoxylate reductase